MRGDQKPKSFPGAPQTRSRRPCLALACALLLWLGPACGDEAAEGESAVTDTSSQRALTAPPAAWGENSRPRISLQREEESWEVRVSVRSPQPPVGRLDRIELLDESGKKIATQKWPEAPQSGRAVALADVVTFRIAPGPRSLVARVYDNAGSFWEGRITTE